MVRVHGFQWEGCAFETSMEYNLFHLQTVPIVAISVFYLFIDYLNVRLDERKVKGSDLSVLQEMGESVWKVSVRDVCALFFLPTGWQKHFV